MNNESNASGGGITILGVLQIVFIVLKLCKVIDWSWWLVLIPLWIELIISVICIGILIYLNMRY